MTTFTAVAFTHANLNQRVYVTKEHIYSIYFSDAQKCTYIVSVAGAIMPVKESVEEARGLVYTATTNQ